MPQDNLRHAQYGKEGTQVDTPQMLYLPTSWDPSTGRMYAGNLEVPFPGIIANVTPNLTLNDTSGGAGTTATPFGVGYTIPGGLIGANSAIEVYAVISWTGGNTKSTLIRVGSVAAGWAGATQISGQSGLSAQLYTPVGALLWNDGVTNQQRGTPANAVSIVASSTSSAGAVTNIDTAVDWNVYVGVQFGVLNGGDTATLRKLIIKRIP